MAKQVIDKKTKEMPLLETWTELENTRKEIVNVSALLDDLQVKYTEVKGRINELKAAGINYAGTTYLDN